MSGFPILELPIGPVSGDASSVVGPLGENADAHLRSTQAVSGYSLQANNGNIGHVIDFMMNDQSWVIEQLVVRIGHRLSGKEVLVPTQSVFRISYPDSSVYVKLAKQAIAQETATQ